jgi:hypothetical protein
MSPMSGTSRRLSRTTFGALVLAVVLAVAPGAQAAPAAVAAHFAPAANPNANPNADNAKPETNPHTQTTTTTATTTTTTPKPGKEPPVRHGQLLDQGVVQSVSTSTIVLKELDGSSVSVPVDAQTQVLVDGVKALLKNIKPGFVAIAKWKDGKAATQIRAFDLVHDTIVKSVLKNAVVVTKPGGATRTIKVNATTKVYIDGVRSKLQSVEPGFIVVPSAVVLQGAAANANKPVAELRVLNPS